MLKTILKALFVVVGLSLAFLLGAFSAARYHWGTPIATIHVRNDTTEEIHSISVTYTTCNTTRSLRFAANAQHANKAIERDVFMKVVLCGEGSHVTEVVFSNGKTLRSTGSYIEGGYEVTERVLESKIESEYTRTFP